MSFSRLYVASCSSIEDSTSPYLFNITTGNMMNDSLIFHTQESWNHFEYRRNKTTYNGVLNFVSSQKRVDQFVSSP